MSPEKLRFSLLLIDTFCFVYSVPIRVLKSMHCVTANYSRVTNLLCEKEFSSPPVVTMLVSWRTEQNRTDCLFDINHTVSSQSHIHITQ